ncbi:hypothetical protein D3C72_2564200 [compost metagenome]
MLILAGGETADASVGAEPRLGENGRTAVERLQGRQCHHLRSTVGLWYLHPRLTVFQRRQQNGVAVVQQQ